MQPCASSGTQSAAEATATPEPHGQGAPSHFIEGRRRGGLRPTVAALAASEPAQEAMRARPHLRAWLYTLGVSGGGSAQAQGESGRGRSSAAVSGRWCLAVPEHADWWVCMGQLGLHGDVAAAEMPARTQGHRGCPRCLTHKRGPGRPGIRRGPRRSMGAPSGPRTVADSADQWHDLHVALCIVRCGGCSATMAKPTTRRSPCLDRAIPMS